MPKPDRIPTKKRNRIIGSYRKILDNPSLDQELKAHLLKLAVFESEKDLYTQEVNERKEDLEFTLINLRGEIDKAQRELDLVNGGLYYLEDLILTRHYYLEDQRGNGNGNGGNPT